MLTLQFRPSSRMLNQVGRLERLAGQWDRLSESSAIASEELREQALVSAIEASLCLDTTTPVDHLAAPAENSVLVAGRRLAESIVVEREEHGGGEERLNCLLSAISDALALPGGLSTSNINHTFHAISSTTADFRTSPINFAAPRFANNLTQRGSEEAVFSTVPAFLVQKRLDELVQWVNGEVGSSTFHPLVVVGTFHLLFLQISPYTTRNHTVSLLWSWKLLAENGYDFVNYNSFIPLYAQRSNSYFNALRQAEKTAGGNWSSLNIWLEFFFDSLLFAMEELINDSMKRTDADHLTSVQKTILDLVKNQGSATREIIARQTGLNVSTVKYNLSVLADKGHLQRHGGGRSTSYSLN